MDILLCGTLILLTTLHIFDRETDDVLTGLEQCTGNLKLSEKNQDEEDPKSVTDLTTTQTHDESLGNCTPHFAPLYISVVQAPDGHASSTQLTKHEKELLSEYQQREGVQISDLIDAEGVTGWTGEMYESATVKHSDKAFHKFNKTLKVYPQQCLRYELVWRGEEGDGEEEGKGGRVGERRED